MHEIIADRVNSVKFLLDSNADIEAKDNVIDGQGMTGGVCDAFWGSTLGVYRLPRLQIQSERTFRTCDVYPAQL